MVDSSSGVPDHTAVRVALWRALHALVDPPPHVLDDTIGLQLADPGEGWRERPDMDLAGPGRTRMSIVARARLVEDLVAGESATQYVILGAGLDSFAQRRADLGSRVTVFEVDQPATQAWKRQRLIELGYGVPDRLRLVPVDFEAGDSWWERLVEHGFDAGKPAVVASTGVSMYLTKEANAETLRQVARLAPGSVFATTFQLPLDLLDEPDRSFREMVENAARRSGTPFLSFYAPDEIGAVAAESGFSATQHVSGEELIARYFGPDGVREFGRAEEFLVATV